jgi:hypothetical protein
MNWSNLVDTVLQGPVDGENVLLFTSKPLDKVVGKNLIIVANDLVKSGASVAFIVSPGPCPQCTEPTVYNYDGRPAWTSAVISDPQLFKTNLPEMKQLDGAYVYSLQADQNLDIKSQAAAQRIQNKQLAAYNGSSQMQQIGCNSGTWVFVIVIVLILLLLWLLFKNKKPSLG